LKDKDLFKQKQWQILGKENINKILI